ncbi:hypothetical protein RND81_12G174600 [Saponaria officinalis]|uniref:UBA domain-containing protein n=1 Tax=Saponaria officinalis TaxID=3572 RepID=A0AAW1HBZ0_SAPOF
MSSISKSKSKDKKAVKEQKTPAKSSVVVNGGNGLPASAYNPQLGTFLTIDTSSTSLAQVLHGNGRFRNIDDSEDHSTNASGGEYDSASNNDTRSVESEEQNKEKSNAPNKQEAIPGSDIDKREKIRLKNERKHQRQKERRAQELHERCSGFLMSRKLEALAQQLVSMGFSQERATMALILNEGRVEEAVAWLFEGGEDSENHKDQNFDSGNNLKIDISEELTRIAELEIKFKCSKQEVERAVVTCEGDLEKSEEILQSQKQDQPTDSPKPEENGDPPTFCNGKISVASSPSNVRLLQQKLHPVSLLPQRRDDKDFNYTKAAVTVGSAPKSVPKIVQPVTRIPPKVEWTRSQQIVAPAEKTWPVGGGLSPSFSYSVAPSIQISPPPSKVESRYVSVGNEYKNLQLGSVREPVVMMQRPQYENTKTAPVTRISSSSPGSAVSWYPSSSEAMKSNGSLPHIPSTRSPSPTPANLTSNPFLHPTQYQHQHQSFPSASSPMVNLGHTLVNGQSSRMGVGGGGSQSPTLAPASSLGLFSGLGPSYSYPSDSTLSVDWNASSSMPSCDYTSIDWSLDPSKPNSFWAGLDGPFSRRNGDMYGSGGLAMGVNLGTRPSSSNGNGVPSMGLQDEGAASADPTALNSREWTSPFGGKDLFSLPRQYVFSPSL